jgi:bacterioferritin
MEQNKLNKLNEAGEYRRDKRSIPNLERALDENGNGQKTRKGHETLLVVLNQLLADELTAINQYTVHAEMCDNWGYDKLHQAIEKQARDEMQHAGWLIQRILFLEGVPAVSKLNPTQIGKSVLEMIGNDQEAELAAAHAYNAAIRLAHEVDDQVTADLLTTILKVEEGHVDWAEKQRTQTEQMGLENYLAKQTEGAMGSANH